MTDLEKCVRLDVINGLIVCPRCHRRIPGLEVLADTVAAGVGAQCKSCKYWMTVDIVDQQVYIRSGQRV